jgi:hypothetical protein
VAQKRVAEHRLQLDPGAGWGERFVATPELHSDEDPLPGPSPQLRESPRSCRLNPQAVTRPPLETAGSTPRVLPYLPI